MSSQQLHQLSLCGIHLLRTTLLSICLALLLPMASAFAAIELRTYIDTDNNAATGCSISTSSGTFSGAEMASVTVVDLSQPDAVGNVSREICQSGAMVNDPSFAPLTPTRWALGIAAAGPLSDVVESYALSPTPFTTARLGFAASTTDNSQPPFSLLSTTGSTGGASILLGNPAPAPTPLPAVMLQVPAIGASTLMLMAGIVFFVTRRFAYKRQLAAAGSALCLVLAVGMAWAASAIVRDGSPADWGQIAPVANSASTGPLTIRAVYAQADGNTLHLRYDLDLGIRQSTPVDDSYTTKSGTLLSVSAPGVLGNDSPATPAAQVREFRLQGSGSATPAGGSITLVGGSLNVQADGSFNASTSVVGNLKFEYRADNGLSNGAWATVSIDITSSAPLAACGDGKITAPEICDDGNTVTEASCPYGSPNCTACNATCTATLQLSGPSCGDGIKNGNEVCDDGNTANETSCPYGTTNCMTCNATCTATLQLSGPSCGDGIKNDNEFCDDGNTANETSCPYGTASCTTCNATCTSTLQLTGPVCGDGIMNGSEQCDDGNSNNGDNCTNACTVPVCGDGIVQNGVEQCDDGNGINGDGCTNACRMPACGDGIVQTGVEQCDDGNAQNGDGCSATCTIESSKASIASTPDQNFRLPLPSKRTRIDLLAPQ